MFGNETTDEGMGRGVFRSVSRRGFMAGAVALATLHTRADWLKFFRRDREEPEEFHVLRRPFGSDPSREISLLGCGGVRLCVERNNQKKIDRELATEIFDYCYRHGVNAFDTGYIYHGGDSEKFLNGVLAKYPRESFFFSDKMPTWHVKTLDDAKRIFADQLERTAALGYFDVYMLHSVSNPKQYDRVYRKLGVLDYLKDMMAAGKIKGLGFSYHGTHEFLSELVEEFPWTMTLIPFNGVEPKGEPNRQVLAAKKIPIFVMSPLGGGRLAHLNTPARRHLEAAKPGSTPAEWGMRYAASFEGMQTVLSGMSQVEQAVENVRTFSRERFEKLTEADLAVYREAIDLYAKFQPVACTNCRYCECPYGIQIPEVFAWWNSFKGEGRLPADDGGPNDSQELRRAFLVSYYNAIPERARAERCVGCEKCKEGCPQWVFSIPKEMEKIADEVMHVRKVYLENGGRLDGKGVLPC